MNKLGPYRYRWVVWRWLIKVCKYRDKSYADDGAKVCAQLQRDHLGPIILCSADDCPILKEHK